MLFKVTLNNKEIGREETWTMKKKSSFKEEKIENMFSLIE
jgi:hypothetical protein